MQGVLTQHPDQITDRRSEPWWRLGMADMIPRFEKKVGHFHWGQTHRSLAGTFSELKYTNTDFQTKIIYLYVLLWKLIKLNSYWMCCMLYYILCVYYEFPLISLRYKGKGNFFNIKLGAIFHRGCVVVRRFEILEVNTHILKSKHDKTKLNICT